jgi:hypothetical protein
MPAKCNQGAKQGLRPLLGPGLLAIALATSPGCVHFSNPPEALLSPEAQGCRTVPKIARDHVYVFFVNGVDPVCMGKLSSLRNCVNDLGFTRTYCGQIYHLPWFMAEIRKVRAHDPDARIAVFGSSLGVSAGQGMAWLLQDEGIHIDLLVDLSTCHDATLAVVAQELMVLASSVPVVELPLPRSPFEPEGLPRPRLMPSADDTQAGWNLLAPTANLRDVPSLATGIEASGIQERVTPDVQPRQRMHEKHQDNSNRNHGGAGSQGIIPTNPPSAPPGP